MVPNVPGSVSTVPPILLGSAGAKQSLRMRIRAERRERPRVQRLADAEAFAAVVLETPEVQVARCVALYASVSGEPGTEPLRSALRRAGVLVLLPVPLPGSVLDWAEDTGELVPGTGPGGSTPTGPRLGVEALRHADAVIVPALAVDTLGQRLGQGGGYYDRALPLVSTSVPVLAMVHEGELLDAAVEPVPTEGHDVGVDAVVTPRRCLRLPPRHL
jgi:5-formyltetrahydrofolate cyclo-ligase